MLHGDVVVDTVPSKQSLLFGDESRCLGSFGARERRLYANLINDFFSLRLNQRYLIFSRNHRFVASVSGGVDVSGVLLCFCLSRGAVGDNAAEF